MGMDLEGSGRGITGIHFYSPYTHTISWPVWGKLYYTSNNVRGLKALREETNSDT